MLRTALALGVDLASAVAQVNDQLAATLPDGLFITAFVGLLQPTNGELMWLSAGQAPLLLARGESTDLTFERLKAQWPPLGMVAGLTPTREQTTTLAPGDALLLMTDGVLEAESPAGQPFDVAGVEAVYRRCSDLPLDQTAQRVLQGLAAHCAPQAPEDDVTLLWLRRRAN